MHPYVAQHRLAARCPEAFCVRSVHLLALVDAPEPPARLFLGEDALGLVEQKLAGMAAEIAEWNELSRLTSYV